MSANSFDDIGFYKKLVQSISGNINFNKGTHKKVINKGYDTYYFFDTAFLKIIYQKAELKIEVKIRLLIYMGLDALIPISSTKGWACFSFSNEILNSILRFADDLFSKCYELQNPYTFGCCSRYIQCSDAKKCVHPDHDFATGCYYKQNLNAGKIFYGKNETGAEIVASICNTPSIPILQMQSDTVIQIDFFALLGL